MKKLLTAILFLFFSLILSATNHYVATGGGGSGTLISPFASLTQVNAHSYAAGDSILFKGGDTFYGTLIVSQSGSSGSRIGIGRYSTGANPIITGFTTVSAWTNLGSNIWESTSAVSTLSTCNMVTINGVNTPMGRYPNTGYLTFQTHSGTSSITSNSLNGTPDWTGAELVIRTAQFVLDRTIITGQSTGTLSYSPATSWAPTNNWGFFIQNDVRTLDVQNEWYYNPSTKKIRIYSVSSPVNVKVSSVDFTCELYKDYLTFENITFEGANSYNFDSSWSGGNTGIVIRNCSILNAGMDGIRLSGISNLLIEDNIITDSNNNGINLYYNEPGAIIRSNTVTNSGLYAGMGQSQMKNYTGIYAGYQNTCDDMVIENNNVINSGYCGINFEGDGILVNNNYVNIYCSVLEDGGGIYTNNEGSASSVCIITGNIVLNGIGANTGTDQLNEMNVAGIYLDANSNDIEVSHNTVANSVLHGIVVSRASNFNVHDNTVYNCFYQLQISHSLGASMTGGSVLDNIFFAKASNQWCASFFSATTDVAVMATFDRNYYARPIDNNLIFHVTQNNGNSFQNYTLAGWQTFIGQDANSHGTPVTVSDTTGAIHFIYNATNRTKHYSTSAAMVDAANTSYSDNITLSPYTSKVLIGAGTLLLLPPELMRSAGGKVYRSVGGKLIKQ